LTSLFRAISKVVSLGSSPKKVRYQTKSQEYLSLCFSKDVRLPIQLQRAMAAEAEAAREAKAKVSSNLKHFASFYVYFSTNQWIKKLRVHLHLAVDKTLIILFTGHSSEW
jgi:hypothetical protein